MASSRSLAYGSLVTRLLVFCLGALLLGVLTGQLLGAAAGRLIGLANGYGAILIASAAIAVLMLILERLRPRSGIPAAVAAVATLVAAGPLGLYYVLPAVVLVTPIAVYRAVKQKHTT